MHRRTFLVSTAALTAGLPWTVHAQSAQGFPSRPITLICPWPAGGPTDIVMRAMAEVAGRHLGQPVIVDNKAGANGTLGPATVAAMAKPDGYTLTQTTIGLVRLPLMQKTAFDPVRDFTYIAMLAGYIFGVSVKGDSPFKSWADVLAYAKANPGKLTYGHPGSGGSLHIGMEQMAADSGVKLTQVPYKGEAEILAAMLGGHVDLMASGTGRQDMIDAGTIRILSVWTEKRIQRLPDVPSIRELGYPYSFDSPWGIGGPKGMDPAVVKILQDAFKAALDDPSVRSAMARFEILPIYKSAEDYTRFVPEAVEQERGFLDRIGLLKKE